MPSFSATVQFSSRKNCFIYLSKSHLAHLQKTTCSDNQCDLYAFKLSDNNGRKFYMSHSCDSLDSINPSEVHIPSLFCHKQGISCDDTLLLTQISAIAACEVVFLEAVSDDYLEILCLNRGVVEEKMLDQLRIVWPGQVFPFWVSQGSVIYFNVSYIKPLMPYGLLVKNTRVDVSYEPRKLSLPKTRSMDTAVVVHSRTPSDPLNKSYDSYFTKFFTPTSYLASFFWPKANKLEEADSSHPVYSTLECTSAIVLRVQANNTAANYKQKPTVADIFCKKSVKLHASESVSFPTTVFVKRDDIAKQSSIEKNDVPDIFHARLKRLLSPTDRAEASAKTVTKTEQNEPITKPKLSPQKHRLSLKSAPVLPSLEFAPIVKVVTIDELHQSSDTHYLRLVFDAKSCVSLSKGQVFINNCIRRQLKLDLSGKVQLLRFEHRPCIIEGIVINILNSMPSGVSPEQITVAFRSWLDKIIESHRDVLIYHQTPVLFPSPTQDYMEAILLLEVSRDDQSNPCRYGNIQTTQHLSLSVTFKENLIRTKPSGVTHTPIRSVSEIDPPIPDVELHKLGAISHICERCLAHIDLCLRERPLLESVLSPTCVGVNQGCLLITGPRGSGKTTLTKALCNRAAIRQPYAYTISVDCKKMRGKRVETIEKMLMNVFNEAAWRHPSVIVLDDLDHVASSLDAPESEHSGEALYSSRVADVVHNLLKSEASCSARLAVIITSQSRSSINSNLVQSRGSHILSNIVEITPPNKKERVDILECIMRQKNMIDTKETLKSVDMLTMASRMEGFIANDLAKVIDRAMHATLKNLDSYNELDRRLVINEESFEAALNGFTAASMRHISLYKEESLTWSDVGGLQEVKDVLIQTTEWPTKFGELFSNCPLRLPSGILLYGAPGTGKTLLAGIVAKECGVNFISIKGPEVLSKYIGASEEAVRDVFIRAQGAKPCVVFFDEFDAIAPRRGHDSTGVTDRVVNQLLTQLDGIESLQGVYVLAATSRPDLIDPALLRPGRLDKCLYCPMPTCSERVEILRALSRKMNLSHDVDFEIIAELAINFTGADIKALLYNSQLSAIHLSPMCKQFEYAIQCDVESDSDLDSGVNTWDSARLSSDEVVTLRRKARESEYSDIEEDMERQTVHPLGSGQVTANYGKRMSFIYIPALDEGIGHPSAEKERQFKFQVSQLEKKLRRKTTERVRPSTSFSENLDVLDEEPLVEVNQYHLLSEVRAIKPSVSAAEQKRFKQLYAYFVSGRGMQINQEPQLSIKRQTLA